MAARTGGQPDGEIVDLLQRAGAAPPPELEDSMLQAHVGKYRSEVGMEVEMRLEDGELFAMPAGQGRIRLVAIDKTTFRALAFEGVTVKFNFEVGKTVGFVLQDGHRATKLQRVVEIRQAPQS